MSPLLVKGSRKDFHEDQRGLQSATLRLSARNLNKKNKKKTCSNIYRALQAKDLSHTFLHTCECSLNIQILIRRSDVQHVFTYSDSPNLSLPTSACINLLPLRYRPWIKRKHLQSCLGNVCIRFVFFTCAEFPNRLFSTFYFP